MQVHAAAMPQSDSITEGNQHESAEPAVAGMFAALAGPMTPPLRCRRAAEAANDAAGNTQDSPEGERAEAPKRQLARIVGPRLLRARTLAGYGQHEAAKLLGLQSPTQLALQEAGHRLIPAPMLGPVATLYDVSVDFLLGLSPEPDRDPAAGARAGILRGIRGALDRMAGVLVDQIDRHERLIGPGAADVRGLVAAGKRLEEAASTLIRLNSEAFENMRGGASVVHALNEFTTARLDAERRLRLSDARDADLRAALAALHTDDITLPAEED